MDTSIINRLAERLREYKETDLNGAFEKVRFDAPNLSVEEQNRLKGMEARDRQLELKRLVGERLQGSFENEPVNEWIVHTWGGITRFDVSKSERITGFRDHLAAGRLTGREFARISSLSKIASFANRERYFVYDSRVAFALDGFLLDLMRKDNKLKVRFFPIPSAQAQVGRDEMMRRMIAQEHPGAEYLTPADTYAEYNALILALANNEHLKKELPSCWVEMLLFYLGRTGGEVEDLFDFNTIRAGVRQEKKRSPSKKKGKALGGAEEELPVISLDRSRKPAQRDVLFGYDIRYGDRRYYLFVGRKPSFHYIELLDKKGETLDGCDLVPVLERRGFNTRRKGYIYKRLDPFDEAAARAELEDIKTLLANEQNFDLKKILRDSLYYPSSATDGGIIKFCNENFDKLGISSFVYADYGYDEEQLLWRINGITGYRVVKNVSLKPEDLLPKGPIFMPSSISKEEYLRHQDLWKKPFARFFILEREEEFGDWHGPSRFTLLYIGGEGVATYSGLYLSNGITPKAVAIIQPGAAFGGNWTRFQEPGAPFHEVVMHGDSIPEYVFYGGMSIPWGYGDFEWPGYHMIGRIHPYYTDDYCGEVTIWHNDIGERAESGYDFFSFDRI